MPEPIPAWEMTDLECLFFFNYRSRFNPADHCVNNRDLKNLLEQVFKWLNVFHDVKAVEIFQDFQNVHPFDIGGWLFMIREICYLVE